MSQNELLLKIKGDSSGGTKAIAETRAAMATLRTSTDSSMAALRVSTTNAAKGTSQVANGFQALTSAVAVIDGPLGGIAGRLNAMGTTASEVGQVLGVTGAQAISAGSSIAAIAGPVGIAVAAFVGLTVASYSLVKGLFNLAETAADFRGKMFDLSQQTGVAVETLSALEIIATTTGGSIESIAQSLVIFQGHLDEAQDASSKMGIKFKELAISTNNTEDAFIDALKVLSEMPEGFHQTNEAAELFGKRGGKQVLAMLKEMDGDLPSTIAKLRALGLVISEEDARAADEFNDQLAILTFQFRAMLGSDVIPAALIALKSLSALFQENSRSINFLGEVLGAFSNTVLAGFLLNLQEVHFVLVSIEEAAAVLDRLMGNRFPGLTSGVKGSGLFDDVQGGAGAVAPRKGTGGRKSAPKDTFLQDARELAELSEREAIQRADVEIAENQRALDEQVRSIEDFTARAIALENQRQDAAMVRIISDVEALDAALAKKLIKGKEYDLQLREIDLRRAEAVQANSDAVFKLEQDRDKKLADAQLAAKRREIQIAEEADQRTIDRIKNRIDRQVLLESEGETEIGAIIDEGFARRRKALEEEETIYGITLERRKDIVAELIRLDGDRAKAAEDAAQRIEDALFTESLGRASESQLKGVPSTPPVIEGPTSAIEQLYEAINKTLTGDTQTAALAGLGAMTEAFEGLGQAVGQVVQSFVLYGSAGTSVRKVTAQILAGIAQQAAMKAVFELAEGFAALALAFFGLPNAGPSAAAHFTAAAIYGTIAGVAAIAGRAVAGNSFADKGSGASSSGGGRTANASPSPSTPATREVDRRGSQPGGATLTIRLPHGWLGDELKKDYDLNGYSRLLITTGG